MKACDRAPALSPGTTPAHGAICWGGGKPPSSNLLLILITDREPRLCLWRFLRVAGPGLRGSVAGAAGRLQMLFTRGSRATKNPSFTKPQLSSCVLSHDALLQYSNAAWSLPEKQEHYAELFGSFPTTMDHLVLFMHTVSNGSEHIILFTWVL